MAGHQAQGLERRSVVSSFIFHLPHAQSEKPRVALFKRSAKVSTYKHHLAPISGSISRKDPNPLAAAWRELSEETRLSPATLTLWRFGKPFSFADESVGREWTVHPFGFLLKGPVGDNAIKIDWEHEGWEWYDPTAVVNDDGVEKTGVPHLRESLRRVWFEGEFGGEAGRALSAGLEKLQNDHESGSHELTSIALKEFRDFIVQMQPRMETGRGKWWEDVQMAAWHLVKNGRESMGAATLNALLAILEEMEEVWKLESSSEWKLERMLTTIDHHLKSRTGRADLVKEMFGSYVRSNFLSGGQSKEKLTILTLSASSTIRDSIVETFASLDISRLELRILESRPLFEGVSIASSISSHFQEKCKDTPDKRLHISIYADAPVAVAAEGVDIVLLGADRISRSKGVSNKTGSLPLVLSTKHTTPSAKIVVLTELEKVNGESGVIDDERHEDNDPAEVVNAWKSVGVKGVETIEALSEPARAEGSNVSVDVRNIYFEWVPLSLIDAFVSGEGVLSDDRIHEKANQQQELASRYFDSISVRY
ncbi:hypothetical protein ASPSYDRAFT_39423 [Aspergillus sydowii CBS 593.65]|uniref:Nudix hydrolase domain-containing protein n=1 Tax=Aspergillus sydowii CBS 593.65 TaxID=1036612 RepID=A0A1L9TZ11_9EURO|nr:uncharacterized protein ASPSYDRAFT_39423 [Aspergillus sydowii CBS 593.65]OJJ64674.1 hypothetical protein ASPSYDRAFT_39423 [Aspergillus sydowii CBS 593.65]